MIKADMSNKRVLCIVGKTSSGKDTIANYISSNWGIPQVCSYTTRPKRAYEINGVHHMFISKDTMKDLLATDEVIAYTINDMTGIEYCATLDCLHDGLTIYIINPDGVSYLRDKFPNLDIITLYVSLSNELIINRGIYRGDDIEVLTKRLESETEEFDTFYKSGAYDYCIDNSYSEKCVYAKTDEVMKSIIEGLMRDDKG